MALNLQTKGSAVYGDSQHLLNKQRGAIEKLRADNLALKEELLLENRFSVQPSTANAAALIKNLKDQGDALTLQIKAQRTELAEVQESSKELHSVVDNQRRDMGGITAAHDEDIQARKALQLMEGRTQQANVRLNEAHTRTRTLKASIDDVRREKLACEDLLRKLASATTAQRVNLAAMLKSVHAANIARDRAVVSLNQLTALGDREQFSSEAEWETLTQLIEDDRRQQEAERMREIEARELRTQAILKAEASTAKQEKAAARSHTNKDASAQRIAELQDAFSKVEAATGGGGIESLLLRMIALKDSNFSLLSYVADLNAEVDKTEGQITALTAELDQYKGSGASAADARRQNQEDLESKLSEAVATASQAEARALSASAALATVRKQVGVLFEEAGCNTPAVRGLLGSSGVQDTNLVQYLGIIEQRAHELLQEYVVAVSQGDSKAEAARVNALMTASGPISPEASQGQASTHSVGSSIGALPIYTIDAPSTTGTREEGPLSYLGEEGDDLKDGAPVDRKVLEARIEKALAKHGDAAIHPKPLPAPVVPAKGQSFMATATATLSSTTASKTAPAAAAAPPAAPARQNSKSLASRMGLGSKK
ncbi:hypothetical protein WJX73_005724 [Symbiochloris irregularis]|uniref:ODAD1 central coiled coil region domain-containing protein n=1 Tax=Symbiochloris irregularis TaxID=706552 RepID=A0AAW1PBF1_9CHLO